MAKEFVPPGGSCKVALPPPFQHMAPQSHVRHIGLVSVRCASKIHTYTGHDFVCPWVVHAICHCAYHPGFLQHACWMRHRECGATHCPSTRRQPTCSRLTATREGSRMFTGRRHAPSGRLHCRNNSRAMCDAQYTSATLTSRCSRTVWCHKPASFHASPIYWRSVMLLYASCHLCALACSPCSQQRGVCLRH